MDEHELRSRMAIEAAGMAIWDATVVNGRVIDGVVHWSARAAAMVGLPPCETAQAFPGFLALVHEADRDELLRAMQSGVDARAEYRLGYRVRLPGGALRSIRAEARTLCDQQGHPNRTLGLIRDVTELIEQQRASDARERMAEVTLDSIGDGVITTDEHGITRYMNRAAERLTGWARERAAGHDVAEVLPLVDEADNTPLDHSVYKCLLKREAVGLSARAALVQPDGGRIAVEDTAAPIRLADGEMLGAVMVFRDVTHQRALSSQLSWHASHDVLTGLCNRREFERHVAHALHVSKQADHAHVLLYVDLDRFKLVNDSAGHAAGDALLQVLADMLQRKMRESDVLARLGGDELGVLLGYCRLDQARVIAEEIRQMIKEFRFVWDQQTFEIGASIGMVEISADSKSVSDLLVAADEACYMAKDQGRNRIHVYAENDAVLARRHSEMMWVPRLNQALERDGFVLYAMPIAGLQGRDHIHEEILLRLKDEAGDLIRPDRFIPAAERYHMMPTLDRWVIRAVCGYIASHRAPRPEPATPGGEAPLPMYSINLSGPSMNDDTLHQFIIDQFSEHGIDPARICFEVTETAAIRNLPKARELMTRLKLLGCRFSLDDFGSGLSSFGYLKSLPVDFLKIDGAFIRGIADNPVHRAIVEAIHRVGRVIGVQTIAEFVEDTATLDVVNNIGIDYAQGYAVGRERAIHA